MTPSQEEIEKAAERSASLRWPPYFSSKTEAAHKTGFHAGVRWMAEKLGGENEKLRTELDDFHCHTIDQGFHDCEGIPGGCPVANLLRAVDPQVGKPGGHGEVAAPDHRTLPPGRLAKFSLSDLDSLGLKCTAHIQYWHVTCDLGLQPTETETARNDGYVKLLAELDDEYTRRIEALVSTAST
jgi:hypothetical protein